MDRLTDFVENAVLNRNMDLAIIVGSTVHGWYMGYERPTMMCPAAINCLSPLVSQMIIVLSLIVVLLLARIYVLEVRAARQADFLVAEMRKYQVAGQGSPPRRSARLAALKERAEAMIAE